MLIMRRRPSLRAVVVIGVGVVVHGFFGVVCAAIAAAVVMGTLAPASSQCYADLARSSVAQCPGVELEAGYAGDDYADMVVWQGRDYVSLGTASVTTLTHLGAPVTTVACSFAGLGSSRIVGTWPDRTATGLAYGDPLYAVPSASTRCQLAAVVGGEVRIYTAVDFDAGLEPVC